ncbi:MAG: beta-galactosidase small subunit [Pseudoflavonifractor sp.]|nr:beta-galactosidase small subunit [Pseudoflavonifractor sp.]
MANAKVNNLPLALPAIDARNSERLIVSGPSFNIQWNRHTGLIDSWTLGQMEMIEPGMEMTPSFWRAGTDNDYGADMPRRLKVWRNPELKLKELKSEMTPDGLARVIASYDIPAVGADLTMTYTINNEGALLLTQTLTPREGAQAPELMRFGLELPLIPAMDRSSYYGRGPIENYADRKTSAFVGRYEQTASEQFYPYIRPQENGTKSDMRSWAQTTIDGQGLEVTSPELFYASANHYTTASLDDGDTKHQRHSQEVKPVDYTILRLDAAHAGLGGIDSWGARPLEPYRIPFGPMTMTLLFTPVK